MSDYIEKYQRIDEEGLSEVIRGELIIKGCMCKYPYIACPLHPKELENE